MWPSRASSVLVRAPKRLFTTVGQSAADYVVDGTADDVEIQAAIDFVNTAGGGTVFIKRGSYNIATSVKPKSNVYLMGEGMFITKLLGSSTLTTTAIIGDTSFTVNNQLAHFCMSDLELDGTSMPRATYRIGQKGVDSHFLQQCTFKDLYIHDTPASGLGIDNLDRVLIDHIITKNCGTSPTPLGQGSNGIGLGIGGNTNESFIVTNCITENTANSGYLAEFLDSTTGSQAMYVFNNNISINDSTGFSLSGSPNTTVVGNQVYAPTNIGIRAIDFVTHYTTNSIIKGNIVINATSYGIYTDSNSTDFVIEGNTVKGGTVEGILSRGRKGRLDNNTVTGNGKHGIFLGGGPGGPAITDVIISNNTVYNNSIVTANADGIRLDGGSVSFSDVSILGNRCFDDQGTQTQRYGIILSGGTGHSNVKVKDNNARNNKTGSFLKSSFTMASPSTLTVRDNIGVNPDCIYAQGNVTGATTFNRVNGSHITATLTGNITVTLTAGVNEGDTLVLELTQDGTGSRIVTWPGNFKKAGGALVLSVGAAAVDIIKMQWDGTNWIEISRSLNIS